MAHANGRKKLHIVSSTILGIVGTCCVVHANERSNCQHCWVSSEEAMHSGTVRPSLDIVLSPHRTQLFRFGAVKAR